MKNEFASFRLAIQFLTRIPVGEIDFTSERMKAAVRYYPFVGALIGLIAAGVFWLAQILFPVAIAVILSVAATLLITGAFHEDGLADTFDGIGGGQTRERSLEIMRDSRIGVYGMAALAIVLALKVAALSSLPIVYVCAVLVAGHGLSRFSSIMVIATSNYVRDEGTGKPVAGEISELSLSITIFLAVAIICLWWFFLPLAAAAAGLGALAIGHFGIRFLFEKKLGGYTGDTLGAVQQVSEVAFYLGVVAWI